MFLLRVVGVSAGSAAESAESAVEFSNFAAGFSETAAESAGSAAACGVGAQVSVPDAIICRRNRYIYYMVCGGFLPADAGKRRVEVKVF